jgi:hypothetical protein
VSYRLRIGLLQDDYLLARQAEVILSQALEMPMMIGTAVEGITENLMGRGDE